MLTTATATTTAAACNDIDNSFFSWWLYQYNNDYACCIFALTYPSSIWQVFCLVVVFPIHSVVFSIVVYLFHLLTFTYFFLSHFFFVLYTLKKMAFIIRYFIFKFLFDVHEKISIKVDGTISIHYLFFILVCSISFCVLGPMLHLNERSSRKWTLGSCGASSIPVPFSALYLSLFVAYISVWSTFVCITVGTTMNRARRTHKKKEFPSRRASRRPSIFFIFFFFFFLYFRSIVRTFVWQVVIVVSLRKA